MTYVRHCAPWASRALNSYSPCMVFTAQRKTIYSSCIDLHRWTYISMWVQDRYYYGKRCCSKMTTTAWFDAYKNKPFHRDSKKKSTKKRALLRLNKAFGAHREARPRLSHIFAGVRIILISDVSFFTGCLFLFKHIFHTSINVDKLVQEIHNRSATSIQHSRSCTTNPQ
jgi:hypothetical protein